MGVCVRSSKVRGGIPDTRGPGPHPAQGCRVWALVGATAFHTPQPLSPHLPSRPSLSARTSADELEYPFHRPPLFAQLRYLPSAPLRPEVRRQFHTSLPHPTSKPRRQPPPPPAPPAASSPHRSAGSRPPQPRPTAASAWAAPPLPVALAPACARYATPTPWRPAQTARRARARARRPGTPTTPRSSPTRRAAWPRTQRTRRRCSAPRTARAPRRHRRRPAATPTQPARRRGSRQAQRRAIARAPARGVRPPRLAARCPAGGASKLVEQRHCRLRVKTGGTRGRLGLRVCGGGQGGVNDAWTGETVCCEGGEARFRTIMCGHASEAVGVVGVVAAVGAGGEGEATGHTWTRLGSVEVSLRVVTNKRDWGEMPGGEEKGGPRLGVLAAGGGEQDRSLNDFMQSWDRGGKEGRSCRQLVGLSWGGG
eukprot:365948-Chlamydomonas_euryale.AAC.23